MNNLNTSRNLAARPRAGFYLPVPAGRFAGHEVTQAAWSGCHQHPGCHPVERNRREGRRELPGRRAGRDAHRVRCAPALRIPAARWRGHTRRLVVDLDRHQHGERPFPGHGDGGGPDSGRCHLQLSISRSSIPLAGAGEVSVCGQTVRFSRSGLTEEYSVSMDGVRQDFIVEQAPAQSAGR